MFDFLKKKLSESVKKLTKKIEEKPETKPELSEKLLEKQEQMFEEPQEAESDKEPQEEFEEPEEKSPEIIEEKIEEMEKQEEKKPELFEKHIEKEVDLKKEAPAETKKGFFRKIREKIVEKDITGKDIDDFFEDVEIDLLEANLALEVVEFIKNEVKSGLVTKPIKRTKVKELIARVFEDSLYKALNQGEIDIEKLIKKNKPACFVFLGFNGSGKTTSIAKIAFYLKKHCGLKPLIAAGDTFRAASIEQLEVHGEKLGVSVIKHKYGADSAAVIFDARRHAEAKKYDVVLADTAGRMHTNKNLMDELEKVVRVNSPNLKILVIDSLTGNDAVEQARQFNEKIGVDAVIMTKVDVNKKGGSIFSVCYAIKKPILFLGVGQKYEDLQKMEPKEFVKGLLE